MGSKTFVLSFEMTLPPAEVMDTGIVRRSHAMQETGAKKLLRKKSFPMWWKGVTKEKTIKLNSLVIVKPGQSSPKNGFILLWIFFPQEQQTGM